MKTAKIFKELILLTERKLTHFSILIIFITVNNQELGNWFHSFTVKTRIDTFIKLPSFLPYLCFSS